MKKYKNSVSYFKHISQRGNDKILNQDLGSIGSDSIKKRGFNPSSKSFADLIIINEGSLDSKG